MSIGIYLPEQSDPCFHYYCSYIKGNYGAVNAREVTLPVFVIFYILQLQNLYTYMNRLLTGN